MATLSDTLKKNMTKLGGELFAGGTTVNRAAEQTQQSVIPNTPLSAATVGAKPDAAKMVGTPAQKTSAAQQQAPTAPSRPFQLDIPETQLLDWQDKIKKDPRQLTALEQDAVRAAEAMNPNLGSFAGRVAQLSVKAAFSNLAGVAPKINQDAVNNFISAKNQTLPTTNQIRSEDFSKDLSAAVANPSDPKAILNLMTKYNITNPEEITKLITTAGGAEAARQILNPDQVTMDKVTAGMTDSQLKAEFGMNADEIAKVFGPEWRNKTWAEMKSVVNQTASRQTQVRDLMAVVNNPSVGAAQRSAATRALRELGILGVRAAEEKINNIVAQIEDGDQVLVDGKPMEIDQVLGDERLSTLVQGAVDDPTKLAELEKTNPELASWVKGNFDSLKRASDSLSAGVKRQNEVNQTNNNLKIVGKAADGVDLVLDDSVMKMIDPTWGQPSTTVKDLSRNPVMNAINTMTGEDKQNFVTGLNELSKVLGTDGLKSLMSTVLSGAGRPADLFRSQGFTNPSRIQDIISKHRDIQAFDSRFSSNPDKFIADLFGSTTIGTTAIKGFGDLNKALSDPYVVEALDKYVKVFELDVNGDGKFNKQDITDPAKLAAHLKRYITRGGLLRGPDFAKLGSQIAAGIKKANEISASIKAEDERIKSKAPEQAVQLAWADGEVSKLPYTQIDNNTKQEDLEPFIARQIRKKEEELRRIAQGDMKYRKANVDISKYMAEFEKKLRAHVDSLWKALPKNQAKPAKKEYTSSGKGDRTTLRGEVDRPSRPSKGGGGEEDSSVNYEGMVM